MSDEFCVSCAIESFGGDENGSVFLAIASFAKDASGKVIRVGHTLVSPGNGGTGTMAFPSDERFEDARYDIRGTRAYWQDNLLTREHYPSGTIPSIEEFNAGWDIADRLPMPELPDDFFAESADDDFDLLGIQTIATRQQWIWIVVYPDEIAWWLEFHEGEEPDMHRIEILA